MIKKLLFILTIFCLCGFTTTYHWKMNDNAATTVVLDAMETTNATAAQNTDQLDTTGKINGALTFNGSTDVIFIQDSAMPATASAFSAALWIKTTSTTGYNISLASFNSPVGSSYGWFIGQQYAAATAEVLVHVGDGDAYYFEGTTQINDGDWHHIAISYDGTLTTTVYVDGGLEGTIDREMSYHENMYTRMGNYDWDRASPNQWFTGSIDDVRFYTTVRTSGEISAIWNSGSGTEDNALTADQGDVMIIQYVNRFINNLNPDKIGTPMWSCRIKIESWWRNLKG